MLNFILSYFLKLTVCLLVCQYVKLSEVGRMFVLPVILLRMFITAPVCLPTSSIRGPPAWDERSLLE